MSALTLAEATRIVRESVRDKSYRETPLGLEVGRYLRWKRNEWGATPVTITDYESILSKLAVFHADLELSDMNPPVGTERLRECWDHFWSSVTGRTRSKVRSVWVDFFDWAVRERGMTGNPARALAAPKRRDVHRQLFSRTFVQRVLAAQDYPADWLGCYLILRCGVRKGGVLSIQFKNFSLVDPEKSRGELTLFTKGQQIYPIPIVEPLFWRKLGELQLMIQPKPDDHLIPYRQDTRKRRVPLEEAEETLQLDKNEVIGYRTTSIRHHGRQATPKVGHLWWYRALCRAGIVPKGTIKGQNMHRGRHTAAVDLLRATHNLEIVRQLLGHKDIKMTAMYAQLDTQDLAEAMLLLPELEGVE